MTDSDLRKAHLAEQAEAACETVATVAQAFATLGLATFGTGEGDTPAERFCRQVQQDTLNGRMRACSHLRSPQPVFVRFWRPGYAWCLQCLRTEVIPLERAPERADLCDLCDEHTEIFRETLYAHGAVTIGGNLCMTCAGPA